MTSAWTVRLATLLQSHSSVIPVPRVEALADEWMALLLAILRQPSDHPIVVARITELFMWGRSHEIPSGVHAPAVQALAWAFRDVLLDRFPAVAAAAMHHHESLIARLASRVTPP